MKLVWEGEISSISSSQSMNIFHEIHAQNQGFILYSHTGSTSEITGTTLRIFYHYGDFNFLKQKTSFGWKNIYCYSHTVVDFFGPLSKQWEPSLIMLGRNHYYELFELAL